MNAPCVTIPRMSQDPIMKAILAEIRHSGRKEVDFCNEFGISQQRLVQWKKRRVPPDQYDRLADFFGWDVGMLHKQKIIKLEPDKEVLVIPYLNIEGSMGGGMVAPAHEEVVNTITLNRRWAADNLSLTNPGNLRLITGLGDSMKPTYMDGDILVVDTGINRVTVDAVYVMERDNELYIKRIERKVDGSLLVISDNRERHDPYPIDRNELDNIRICGRVVYVWNGKRL